MSDQEGPDLWMLPLVGERKAVPLVRTRFLEIHGQISPDGKWLAYQSNETGRPEIYVQPFPSGAGKWQVSTSGGSFPRWRRDGRELFYMSRATAGKMVAVDVTSTGTTFEAGTAKELFDTGYATAMIGHPFLGYAVSVDGQRFLMPRAPSNDTTGSAPIVVVANWDAELNN